MDLRNLRPKELFPKTFHVDEKDRGRIHNCQLFKTNAPRKEGLRPIFGYLMEQGVYIYFSAAFFFLDRNSAGTWGLLETVLELGQVSYCQGLEGVGRAKSFCSSQASLHTVSYPPTGSPGFVLMVSRWKKRKGPVHKHIVSHYLLHVYYHLIGQTKSDGQSQSQWVQKETPLAGRTSEITLQSSMHKMIGEILAAIFANNLPKLLVYCQPGLSPKSLFFK